MEEIEKDDPYKLGKRAAEFDYALYTNPYVEGGSKPSEFAEWCRGYRDWKKDNPIDDGYGTAFFEGYEVAKRNGQWWENPYYITHEKGRFQYAQWNYGYAKYMKENVFPWYIRLWRFLTVA
jgi:hypothetical protein